MYTWLRDRFASRSMHQLLPAGMPETGEAFSVQTWKDGKAGYILFKPLSMIATAMADSETQVMVEYDNGYMREGIGNAYTIQILYDDFMALAQNIWEIYPAVAYRRLSDGTIVHNCTRDYRAGQLLRAEGVPVVHPPRIIEDKGRGSEIHSREDQGKLLQYWAWAQMPMDVGVIFPTKDGHTYEFCLEFSLAPSPDDDGDPRFYIRITQEIWMERLRRESPYVAIAFDKDHVEDNFGVKMRYVFNKVRLWYVPSSIYQAGFTRSLAEEPCPKDKWISPSGLTAISVPPIPDDEIENLPV
jgi:hypothetical protein